MNIGKISYIKSYLGSEPYYSVTRDGHTTSLYWLCLKFNLDRDELNYKIAKYNGYAIGYEIFFLKEEEVKTFFR